ncbi:hypothetical protein FGIG_03000 [Fasciola gigantica]|uniref:Uncharacterized protein n=1 Tax=Fasciola gigantica TaxID=46835 RepID=A0A504YLF7_FASGI|nr:hypothetical protein FGIG_03000 [Fasciola gigantica]
MEIELIESAGDPTKLKEIVHMRRCSDVCVYPICCSCILTLGVREHEELLEICEQVIDHLWSIQLSGDYRSATSLFLGVCVSYISDHLATNCYQD